MSLESPDNAKDFPEEEGGVGKKRDSSRKRDGKKEKKEKGYQVFEEEDSEEEVMLPEDVKSPTKGKKMKAGFKFPAKKDIFPRMKEKDKDEKKDKDSKKEEKEKKKEEKEGKKVKVKDKEKKKSKHKHMDLKASVPTISTCENPVFGIPIAMAVERNPSHDGIELPAMVRECIDYVEECGLTCEGIYRISGVKSKVQQLKDAYNKGHPVDLVEHEPNIVASLLKQFLRELPEPVLTTQLMPKFEEASTIKNEKKKVETFIRLIEDLPACNRLLLSWMIVHMTHIIELQKENKMSLQNVSIVLSPTMQISHRVLHALFTLAHQIFKDTYLKKYVPPLKPATSRWSLELPDNTGALEEELAKQESLLNQLHSRINAARGDPQAEEQLWEVQRVVTQLKRKIKFSKKSQGSDRRRKDLDVKRSSQISDSDELNLDLRIAPAPAPTTTTTTASVEIHSQEKDAKTAKKAEDKKSAAEKQKGPAPKPTPRTKTDAPKSNAPKSDAPKSDAPKSDETEPTESQEKETPLAAKTETVNSEAVAMIKSEDVKTEQPEPASSVETPETVQTQEEPTRITPEQDVDEASQLAEESLEKEAAAAAAEGGEEAELEELTKPQLEEAKPELEQAKPVSVQPQPESEHPEPESEQPKPESEPMPESVQAKPELEQSKPESAQSELESAEGQRLSEEQRGSKMEGGSGEPKFEADSGKDSLKGAGEVGHTDKVVTFAVTEKMLEPNQKPPAPPAEEKEVKPRGPVQVHPHLYLSQEPLQPIKAQPGKPRRERPEKPEETYRRCAKLRELEEELLGSGTTVKDDAVEKQESENKTPVGDEEEYDYDAADDDELQRLVEEEFLLRLEEEELQAIGDELKKKIQTEQNEIERLQQEIQELQYLRHDSDVEELSSNSDSSYESEDEEEMSEMLSSLIQENLQLEKENAEMGQKIHEERMICLSVKLQIRLLQQKQLESSQNSLLGDF